VNDFHNTYTFDNLQRLTRLDQTENGSGGTPVADKRIDLAYNAASQFTTIVRYKSLSGGSGNIVADTSHVYDNAGRLTSMLHYHNMTMLAEYDWTYDLGSRITTQDFDSDTGNNGASTFSYDATNQLTAADHDFQTDEAYSFDVNGNRTMSGYTTGDNNRLTSDGTWDYGYDDEGNRTWQERISSAQADDKRIEYTWDYRNRLTRIQYKNNQGTVTKDIIYVYDVFDRRIEKQIDDDGAGSGGVVYAHYVYDGPHIALAFNGDGELTNRYVHNPQVVDMILADEQFDPALEIGVGSTEGDTLWPLTDHLGSVREIYDKVGTTWQLNRHFGYDSFGKRDEPGSYSVETLYSWTGREYDKEVELQYNRARY